MLLATAALALAGVARADDPAQLNGLVVDAAGAPLRGITVTAHGPSAHHEVTTDAYGLFTVRHPGEGATVTFTDRSFRHVRMAAELYDDTIEPADAERLPAGTTTLPAVTMTPGGRVAGTVTGSDGEPVRGAYVELVSELDQHWVWTDREGRYELGAAHAGQWDLRITHGFDDFENEFSAEVAITDGQTTRVDPVLAVRALPPSEGVAIRGVLRDSTGRPAAGVPVQALDQTPEDCWDGVRADAYTDGHGRYVLRDLPAGSYRLRFAAPYCSSSFEDVNPDYTTFSETWSGGGDDYATATPVTVPEDPTEGPVTFDQVVRDSGTISGLVLTRFGTPPDAGEVQVYPAGQQPWFSLESKSTRLRPDGSYTFRGLPPGDYKVSFSGVDDPLLPSEQVYRPLFFGTHGVYVSAPVVSVGAGTTISGVNQVLWDRVLLVPPTVSGAPRVGSPLVLGGAAWIPSPDLLVSSPAWHRGSSGPLVGQGAVYVPTAADVGSVLTVTQPAFMYGWDSALNYTSATLSTPVVFDSETEADVAVRGEARRTRVLITVRVRGPGLPAAEGRVTLSEHGRRLRARALDDGTARFVVRRPAPGRHRFVVSYPGSATTDASSTVVRVKVPRARFP